MAYKEKECEQCHQKHTKRGRFCSRECSTIASKGRKWTKEQKSAVSDGLKQWHATSETAELAVYKWSQQGLNPTPEPVAPPVRSPVGDNQFIAGGDLWTECD